MKELINLTIINDSDCTLPIPLFQNNVASINATTKYQWDVTTADLSCGFGSIIVNGSLINITYLPTLVGLVDSLNALNYGFFCTEVIGANTYIYTKDNTNIYSLLDLCPTPTTTTTTTTTSSTSTTTTAIPTTTTTTTTTSSTSTTTTAIPLYRISQASDVAACSGTADWIGTATFSGGLFTLCNCVSVTITSNLGLFDTAVGNNDTFFMSDGVNVRQFQRTGITYDALPIAACTVCAGTTTTTTTTTTTILP
ncbi:MAG: hypothetical protein ACOVNU_04245 [Candidatus Kapaibacteriota bacterium]